MKELGLSIKTTSLCQRMCKNCSVVPWMKANPNFHTSIEQIENLIKYSKESSYHWEYIILGGGEPLLWKWVVPGAERLYNSGICSRLILLTNGLEIIPGNLRKIDTIVNNVHEFRISRYKGNDRNIELAQEYFGKLKNYLGNPVLNIVDRQEHTTLPDKPVPDSLPADCTCKSYGMVGDEIDLCGPARTLIYHLGLNYGVNLENVREEVAAITQYAFFKNSGADQQKVDERDFIPNQENRYQRKICQWCIANSKVATTLKREQA